MSPVALPRLSLRHLVAALALATLPGGALRAQENAASRGTVRFEQGEYAAARADFDAILRANPRDGNALYYLGRIALQEGRSSDAVDLLEKAVRVDETRAAYHVWLGAALGEETQKAGTLRQPFLARRAKAELERAVELDPRNVEARYGLIQFYTVAPKFLGGGIDKAREQIAELLGVSPMHAQLGTAFVAMRQRDTVAAIRAYENAIAAAPDSAAGYISLGALYQRTQRWTDAFAVYDRGLARQPDAPALLFRLGRAAAMSGRQLERGERALRQWLASPPRNAPTVTRAGAHHRLGQILEKKGRRDAARGEYESALRIDPKNEEARKSLAALQ